MIPLNDTLFERTELIPFLERTSEDLRDAEAAVRGQGSTGCPHSWVLRLLGLRAEV